MSQTDMTKTDPKDFYFTVTEVSVILRKHRETIYNWCKGGKLKGARKFNRSWYIPRSTIDPSYPEPQ